ncbi:MAG TPA: aldose epimerase family protein [Clostridia bacterium]|nr:aldose epimerase family protein [Clostridia bacterium]
MIKAYDFGKTRDGRRVTRFRLENAKGAYADVLDFGCTVQSLCAFDGNGALRETTAGFDDVAGYEGSSAYMGAMCGRVANRIGGARFALAGGEYALVANDNGNSLHGGGPGFSFGIWDAEIDGNALRFARTSPDGEYGYPGTLRAELTYEYADDGALWMTYRASTDRPTLYNPTNHCYFTLDDASTVDDIRLWIDAGAYLETDSALIPTGTIIPAAGTPLDFAAEKPIGRDIGQTPMGYDHCLLLRDGGMRLAARARSELSGLTLEVWTDRPAIQLYTGNFLSEPHGRGGRPYGKRAAFCLETQTCPDAVHHAQFPQATLLPGEEFFSRSAYVFK